MATKRTGKAGKQSPAQLSLVGAQSDSRTPAQRRADALARGRKKSAEVRARKHAERKAERGSAPTNLERYRAGDYPVTAWTNEEVRRGRPEGSNGFSGAMPNFNGRQNADIKRELLKRGQNYIDECYPLALKVLKDVALHGEKDADRVKAALALAERTAGKVPERIEIKSSDPWQDILDEVMADDVLEPTNQTATQSD